MRNKDNKVLIDQWDQDQTDTPEPGRLGRRLILRDGIHS